eukprot:IDg22581t1
MTDFSYEPIVRHKLSRGSKRIPRQQDVVDPPDLSIRLPRLSPKVRVTCAITLKPGYQTWVQVSADVAGVHAIEPRGDLLRDHSVSATNGVVDIEPGLPFWLLVANFGVTPYRVNKNATIAHLSVADYPLPPTSMTAGQLLGINYEDTSDDTDHRQDLTSLSDLALGAESRKFDDLRPPAREAKTRTEVYSVDDLDLEHVPESHRTKVREMLRTHESMWSGKLGAINATHHRIEVPGDTKPARQRAYRAGPRARLIEAEEISRQLRDGIIRPSKSEWASPVVLVTKGDGS